MKIIHHEYRSYPTLVLWEDPLYEDKKKEFKSILKVALGKLKIWQHLEINSVKLDGFTVHDVSDWVKECLKEDPMYPYVLRRESNRVRVWRIPLKADWRMRARQSLEYGADSDGGMIEYRSKPKKEEQ